MTPAEFNEKVAAGFGPALEKYREKRKLTRAHLADKADMHSDAILRLERGSRQPNLQTAIKLADVLDVRITKLLEVAHASE